MPLVSSTLMLQAARAGGYCIPAFNVHTLEMLQAAAEAAEAGRSPLILQTTVSTVNHLGADYLVAAAKTAADRCSVPIALHLDHCEEWDFIARCIRSGYTSVMIDASRHQFRENIRRTKRVVEWAAAVRVNVEAELGRVGGVEDEISVADHDALLADPGQCAEFVLATGVDTLAPAIGTAHGIYVGEPAIDYARIERIAAQVAVPLVLHGGSGIAEESVKRCVSLGMAKMNVATELRIAFSDAIKGVFAANPAENDPRKFMIPAKRAVFDLAAEKMRICGSVGKAGDSR